VAGKRTDDQGSGVCHSRSVFRRGSAQALPFVPRLGSFDAAQQDRARRRVRRRLPRVLSALRIIWPRLRGDALSTLYEILEKIDVHHDEDSSEPPWDEIHVLGLESRQLDTAMVEEALSGTRVNISRNSDVVIIQRVVPQAGGVILKGPFAG